jgi:hypothetical protein
MILDGGGITLAQKRDNSGFRCEKSGKNQGIFSDFERKNYTY